ncbi:MAG TPA: hypothetical protein VLC92_08780 [Rhodocyclaceae bacterium]|nr:hypothetical protein [Rhodocyclaceae bacterium]
MSSDADRTVERFMAGDDRLAALLRELPVYEAPAAMTAHVAALARVAQNAFVPAAQLAANTPLIFEPPASLEAGFLAEAARIQAAQQPRHDAVLEEVRAGKAVAAVLGHDVTAETTAWLAGRSQRIAAQAERTAGRPSRAASKWWPRFGVVLASIAFGAVATNLWLAQRHASAPLATAMNEAAAPDAASASASTAVPASAGTGLPPPVALQVAPIAEISAVTRQSGLPPSESKRAVTERLRQYAEIQRAEKQRAMKDEAASAEDAADAKLGREMAQRAAEQEFAPEQGREALAVASARQAPAAEGRMSAPPPAVAPAAVAAIVASPEPAPAKTKKSVDGASKPLRLSLAMPAQAAAASWQAIGYEHVPRIFAAHPQAQAVRSWAEQFRQALPAHLRPTQMRIEQDTRLRDDALRLE